MKRVCLGKITGVHGIKGLVKVTPFGDDPYLIEDIRPLFTGPEGDASIELSLKQPQGSHYLAVVEGVSDRTQAEALKGTELYVPRDALPEIEEEDSYYIEDLVGLETRTEDGSVVGPVIAVHNFGAGDLLEIRQKSGETFMLPFKNETVGDVGEFIEIKNFGEFI